MLYQANRLSGPRQLLDYNGQMSGFSIAKDGTLASCSHDNTVRLWDVETGKQRLSLEGHSNWVLTVRFSPDGKVLASGGRDSTAMLWDPASGKELTTLKGHGDQVYSVAFAPMTQGVSLQAS
ncbi:MAG: hypothetical protein HC938_16045 [Nitrospira sp.]|nr:hypothetical protein [Nitrospira sp.]